MAQRFVSLQPKCQEQDSEDACAWEGTCSPVCTTPAETWKCCNLGRTGMAIWVQPLSSVFLSSGRIRMLLQCRKGSQPKGFSLEALCYTTFKCAAYIIHLLQQEPRQLSVQFAFQSSTLQLPLGGMIRNDMVHGMSDPHYLVGEQLFARVAAVLETPPHTASYRKSGSWFCYQKWHSSHQICTIFLLFHLCLSGLLC